MSSLTNKIIFITGASSSMGKACAEKLAADGARLILAARRIDRLENIATALKNKFNTDILTLYLDIQDKHQVLNRINNLPTLWQNIDILINNAGIALSSVKIH